jgi:hypothetical protein
LGIRNIKEIYFTKNTLPNDVADDLRLWGVSWAAPVVFSVCCSSNSSVDELESQYASLSLLSWTFEKNHFLNLATHSNKKWSKNINDEKQNFTHLFLMQ